VRTTSGKMRVFLSVHPGAAVCLGAAVVLCASVWYSVPLGSFSLRAIIPINLVYRLLELIFCAL
jgi:hypothetical protein